MKNILEAPFLIEMVRTATNMYAHGWDERNGGNISLLLEEGQAEGYVDRDAVIREIPTGFAAPQLEGKYFLVTGTGKYFKNVQYDPENNLGLVQLADGGKSARLLWGFSDGGRFTSEFPAHMMSHAARLAVNPQNRVVMHCHPAHLENSRKDANMLIGKRLREARNNLGLTQAEIAASFGVSEEHYRKYEAGSTGLSADKLLIPYHEYGMDPTYLITGSCLRNGLRRKQIYPLTR